MSLWDMSMLDIISLAKSYLYRMKIEYDLNIRDTIVWDLIVLGIGLGDKCVLDVSVWDMNALEISMWEISESIIWYYNACNIIDDIWVC